MPEQGSRGRGESHFVVLPDHEAALAVARRTGAPRTLTHPSGRPWLVGRWRDDEITVAAAGDVRLAVIGWCPVTVAELERTASGLRDLTHLDEFARTLAGGFHLVASLGGRCRVQGTASGLRLVFHHRIDGVVVAADRADVLGGTEVDERSLAVRLLFPTPHPLLERTMWRDVECVPPGSALLVDGDRARLSRWWQNPEPVHGIAEWRARLHLDHLPRRPLTGADRRQHVALARPGRRGRGLGQAAKSSDFCWTAPPTTRSPPASA